MKPTDIAHLVTLGPPSLSPDGQRVVVSASRPDLDENTYRSALWLAPTDGSSGARRLTHGTRDSEPRFSPDGRWIAFLRAEGEGKPQLQVLPADGGDARALTDLPAGAGSPVWSPDSRSLAFTARVPESGRYGQDEKVPADKEAPRRITGLQYRLDGVGFVLDRRSHVFVLDLADLDSDTKPEARQITHGDYEDTDLVWSPDGTQLAFVSARHADHELDRCTDVFLVRPDGTDLRPATDSSLWLSAPAFGADSSTLVAAGVDPVNDGTGWIGRNGGLWRIDVAAEPVRPARLTDDEAVHVTGERIVLDGERALVTIENRGGIDLIAVPLDGSAPKTISSGRRQIGGFDLAAGVTVVSYADATTNGELARLDPAGPVPLTDFGREIRDVLVPLTEVTATAPDGYPVHGLLAVPPGDGPHPVLLMIHGGPFAQYGWMLLDEAQVYAAAGYAVVYGNPRGSSGYGQAHGRYILNDVGDRQTPDLIALLDAVLARPDLDSSRVGVLGGSHGGYMTSWLIGHSDRFRAAVSERAVNVIDSFEGSSDIGWDFADNLYGRDPEERRRQSPLTYADAINTPLLIVHSEHDWRCPVEQAQRMYVALRKRKATVEMLLFPGEGHELSRTGLPSHRVARFDAILDWFERHLR